MSLQTVLVCILHGVAVGKPVKIADRHIFFQLFSKLDKHKKDDGYGAYTAS